MTLKPPKIETYFPFTKKALEEKLAEFISHGDKAQLTCADVHATGLYAVIYRNRKTVDFRARPIYNGKRLSVSLGEFGKHFTVDQARTACASVRLEAKQGLDPRVKKHGSMTFSEFVTEVYFPLTQRQKRSAKDDVQKFECRLRSCFGDKLVSSITSAEVSEFLYSLVDDEHLSPATTNRYRALLRSVFSLAIDEGVIIRNPVKNIRQLPENNKRTRTLSDAEVKAFVAACNADEDKQVGRFFLLLLLTGVRLGSALDAQIKDVQLDRRAWHLPMTKSGKSEFVQLSTPVLQLLVSIIGGRKSGPLFPGKDPATAITRPAKPFARICMRAKISTGGVDGIVIHDLRRTYGTLLFNSGVPIDVISKLLHHSSPSVTAAHYAHLRDDVRANANELLGKLVLGE
jgi:integrase